MRKAVREYAIAVLVWMLNIGVPVGLVNHNPLPEWSLLSDNFCHQG